MAALRLSVVVVSTDRPRELGRCLRALWQAAGPQLEVIVVADEAGRDAVAALPFADRVKTAEQSLFNIAHARNIGISMAAGDIVAFIDDDAVPEPNWTQVILERFEEEPELQALTGQVLGRNGISLQWGNMSVDRKGVDHAQRPIATGGGNPVFQKLHGTNVAIRRFMLVDMDGFDPRFSFYMDDTDLSVRLGMAGGWAEYLPAMVVSHGFAASARRDENRVPLSLFDIGASTAVFLRTHAPEDLEGELTRLREDQQQRLMRLARQRAVGPEQIEDLMTSLNSGIETGLAREEPADQRPRHAGKPFKALRDTDLGEVRSLWGWSWQAKRLRAEAARIVEAGGTADLLLLEPTPRKHRRAFTDGGWWEQTGGLFGPSDRHEARFQIWTRSRRAEAEQDRLRALRGGAPASPVS